MSGETQAHESGWTTDTLKAHYDQRMIDQEKAVEAALLATKEAILKAETATEKRFESVNEFRGQLNDQTQTFLPRQEYTVQHKALEDRVSDVIDRVNKTEGQRKGSEITKADLYRAVGTGVGVLGFAITVIVLLLGVK